jgi:hypothetical protein
MNQRETALACFLSIIAAGGAVSLPAAADGKIEFEGVPVPETDAERR